MNFTRLYDEKILMEEAGIQQDQFQTECDESLSYNYQKKKHLKKSVGIDLPHTTAKSMSLVSHVIARGYELSIDYDHHKN